MQYMFFTNYITNQLLWRLACYHGKRKQNWDLCKFINRHMRLWLDHTSIYLHVSYIDRRRIFAEKNESSFYKYTGNFRRFLIVFSQHIVYARQIVFALNIVRVKKCSVQRLPKVKLKPPIYNILGATHLHQLGSLWDSFHTHLDWSQFAFDRSHSEWMNELIILLTKIDFRMI